MKKVVVVQVLACYVYVCVSNAFVHFPSLASARAAQNNENISLLTLALKRDMSQLPSGGRPYESEQTIYSSWSPQVGQQQQQQQRNGMMTPKKNMVASQNDQNNGYRVSQNQWSPRDYYYSNFSSSSSSQQQQKQHRNGYRRTTSPFKEWLEKARELVGAGGSSSSSSSSTQDPTISNSNYSYLRYDSLQQEQERKGFRRISPSYQQQQQELIANARDLKKDMSFIPRTFSDHPREYDSTFSFRQDNGMMNYDRDEQQDEFRKIALGDQSWRSLRSRQGEEWSTYDSRDLKRDIANVRPNAIVGNPTMDYDSAFSFRQGHGAPYQQDQQLGFRRLAQNNNLSVEDTWKRESLKKDIARVMEDRRGRNESPIYSPYANDRMLAQQQQAGFRRISSMDQPIPQGLKRDIAQVPDGSSGGSMFSLQNEQRNHFNRMLPYYEQFEQNENDWTHPARSRKSGGGGGRRPYNTNYHDAPSRSRFSYQPNNNRMLSRQERRNELRRKSTSGKSGQDWFGKAREFMKDITRLKS